MSDNGRVDVDAIRAMLDTITPGEWRDEITDDGFLQVYAYDYLVCGFGDMEDTESVDHANAAFIAAAPALVRSMADEIVELRERVAEQSAIIAGLGDVIAGRVKPISQLWDEIEADDAQP